METVLSTAGPQTAFHIGEPSEIAAARRGASELARQLGCDETKTGQVAIAVTEAATNIVKHAERGEILIRPLRSGGASGVEILAIDAGPGMANLTQNMRDGMSTAGSYGVGLGSMQRLADEFDVYTAAGKGTALCMVLWTDPQRGRDAPWRIGAVTLPMPGETVCGDAWAVSGDATSATLLLADGLGHGPNAAAAAEAAAAVIARHPDLPPAAGLQDVHGALRATRGAAVAIARLDLIEEEIRFAGVGNVAACVCDMDERRQLVSHNGIVGANMRKVQEFASPWSGDSVLVMHSDGLATRWDLKHYPGLATRHPSLIAAVLYRDFSRKRDDVSVLVVRENRG